MPNILGRTLGSVREGTVKQKLRNRAQMVKMFVLKRLTWMIWYLGTAPWQCRVKAFILRLHGAKIGKALFMERGIVVKGARKLVVGDHVAIGSFSLLTCSGGVTIDDYVNLSTGCRILSANHKVAPVGEQYRYSGHQRAPVHLKKGCWIATNAIVLPGVTVGEGAVVVAGSLVTKNVPDFAYVGGMPAKFIMFREGYKPPKK